MRELYHTRLAKYNGKSLPAFRLDRETHLTAPVRLRYNHHMDIILVFLPYTRHIFKSTLSGISRYFNGKVRVQVIEHPTCGRDVRRLLAFWNPRGCIVEASEGLRHSPPPSAFGDIPVVYLDPDMSETNFKPKYIVHQDYCLGVDLAARELLSSSATSFAFVGYRVPTSWSQCRGDAFAKTVKMHGKDFYRFPDGHGRTRIIALRSWLKNLPRNTAIFAANDITAAEVVNVCSSSKIRIPEDLLLASIDNDADICESSRPTITSVCPDFDQEGYLAAQLLDQMPSSSHILKYGIAGVVRRSSSCHLGTSNPHAFTALKLIREHAHEGISIGEIAAAMGCSVRLAEIRFREATGRTIRTELENTRLQRACTMLNNPGLKISAIANFCGYRSDTALRIAFVKRFGVSMSEWRKRHRNK